MVVGVNVSSTKKENKMLSDLIRNILAKRTQKYRNSICTKQYEEFVGERINREIQREIRLSNLDKTVVKLNQIVKDTTWLFVIWAYEDYFSVLVFEGHGYVKDEAIIIGEVNENFGSDDNIYIQCPASRRTFSSLKAIEAYVVNYYNSIIREEVESYSMKFAMEEVYNIKAVEVENVTFKQSSAVIFDVEMMRQWQRSKLLPTVKQLYNGKRYNRTTHGKKLKVALESGKIIAQDNHYIIYWR